jgi:acyl-CoA thioester hydrolase
MKSEQKTKYFVETITVKEEHLDSLRHVNNQIYLQWVNDIAKSHWAFLTSGKFDQRYFWVVRRHEIDYLRQAILNDELNIVTWVGDTEGVWSVRHVQIKKGEELLVDVKTTWLLIDSEKNRPVRISGEVLEALKEYF